MYSFITLVKALAACLVVNSHFDAIWPISALATGGAVGNCLFFFSSGFLLVGIKQDFASWYGKRIIRIYPALFIMETVSLLFIRHNVPLFGQSGILASYLLAANYWFFQAIIVFYIAYYIVMRTQLKEHLILVGLGIIIIYFLTYVFLIDLSVWSIEKVPFKWIFYFGIMLSGGGYALRIKKGRMNCNFKLNFVLSIVSFVGFYGFKFCLDKYPRLMEIQFIEHVLLFIFICSLMNILISLEPKLKDLSKKSIWKCVEFVGGLTLEIYLVMDYVTKAFKNLPFPISLLSVILVIFISAKIMQIVSKYLTSLITTLQEYNHDSNKTI